MMIALGLAAISALITIAIGAISLPVAKWIVMTWVRFYTSLVPPSMGQRRYAELLSDTHDQITAYTLQNYRPSEIASKLMYRWVMGLKNDLTWCAPYTPSILANKAAKLSQSLWASRKSKMAIPAIGVFGFMNYAYLSSNGERTWAMWLGINVMTAAMVALLSQQHRVWVRRVLYAIMGVASISALGFMAWYVGPTKLYEMIQLPVFRGLLLGITALGLILLTANPTVRTRVFKGRWAYVILCWVVIIVASLVASVVLAGSVTPVLSTWATMATLLAALLVFFGAVTLIAAGIWYGALKGGAAGLQALANVLRHIK
jgi:hypothetical protein